MLRSLKQMKHLLFFVAVTSTLACASALSACTSSVTCEPGACDTGAGRGGGGGGGGGGGAAAQPGAVLYGTDMLTLRLTSFSLSCGNPAQKPPFDQCDWSVVEVTFPADLLKPGPLDTSNPAVQVFMQSSGKPNSPTPGDCPGTGGGGGSLIGMITFVSVDAASVVVDIEGLDPVLLDDHDVNGTHTVTRCP